MSTLEPEFPTQLSMYELAINGSQANWARMNSSKNKENLYSDIYSHSMPIKFEDCSPTPPKTNMRLSKKQDSLTDLF